MWRCWCEDKNWLWPDEGGCQSLIERDRKDSWVRCRVRCYSQTKTTHKPGRVVSGQHIRSGVRIVQKRGWIMSRTAHQIVDDVTVGKQGNGSKHFSLEVKKGKIAIICMRSSTKTYKTSPCTCTTAITLKVGTDCNAPFSLVSIYVTLHFNLG